MMHDEGERSLIGAMIGDKKVERLEVDTGTGRRLL